MHGWMDGRSIRHNDMMALPRHALWGVKIGGWLRALAGMNGRKTNRRARRDLPIVFDPPKLVKTTAQRKERVANQLFKDAIDPVQAHPSISLANIAERGHLPKG